ncbi:hypothetical protein PVAND_007632 [Polypedilum vanderplanki]|uniref:Uncharacterized protein n=1 Tax=Polypedilum vanderplanki TaxID=319348 RepID=A0A9J6C6X2_POLVA|nr:hypothetical protein PVAND_007632 [Polypedilum vanderplanki]
MNSIGENCNELKSKYDQCFNTWFSEKFLKGDKDDTPCKSLFQTYQKCVQEALTLHQIDIKDLKTNHIDGTEFEKKSAYSDSKNKNDNGTSEKES